MDSITVSLFEDAAHRDQVVELWAAVFGYETAHNDPKLAIAKKMEVGDELFFVALDGSVVVGTAMAGYDGHRGWIYSVAVAPSHRHRGIGSQLVTRAEEALTGKGCMKINLQILEDNKGVAAFYEACGYTIERRINMGKRIAGNIP